MNIGLLYHLISLDVLVIAVITAVEIEMPSASLKC